MGLGDFRVEAALELEELALGHAGNGAGEDIEHFEVAIRADHIGTMCVEEIADEHSAPIAPNGIGGRLPTTQRAEIDHSIDVILAGDFHDEGAALAVSDPVAEYYDQVFQFQQTGSVRYFDSATQAGRDEFTSHRELQTDGNLLVWYVAHGLDDLSLQMKVTELGKDFNLIVAEDVTIYDPSTP